MQTKRDRLKQLRQRAEVTLKSINSTSDVMTDNVDELVHELHVYHAELELQIEDLQQAYLQLETTQKQYASLFNFAPVSYLTTDAHGKILDANLSVVAMLGQERSALKNVYLSDMITDEYQDTYHLHSRTAIRTHQMQHCEVNIRRKDGTIFSAELRTHLPDSESEILYTAIIDISAVKQTHEVLQQALLYEKQNNQLRNRVLSVISHEFRTPLTAILMSIEFLDRYDEKMTAEKKSKRYSTIRNMIWYLNDVVQDILITQEYNDDLPQLKPQTFELIRFVSHLIDDMLMITEQQQSIVLHTDGHNENDTVTLDENLLRRILMNLIGNALKYSNDEVNCHIDITAEMIYIRIIDRGTGISEEEQEHMYQAFYRGKNAEFIPGTGIGLYVVARAIDAHDGSINCKSVVDQGTTFAVKLPRHVKVG